MPLAPCGRPYKVADVAPIVSSCGLSRWRRLLSPRIVCPPLISQKVVDGTQLGSRLTPCDNPAGGGGNPQSRPSPLHSLDSAPSQFVLLDHGAKVGFQLRDRLDERDLIPVRHERRPLREWLCGSFATAHD